MKAEIRPKEAKGITLIALVVTIIVLLILAGVSIATLTGENGILTQLGNAKEETEIVNEFEKIQTSVISSKIKSKGKLIKNEIEEALEFEFGKDIELSDNSPWTYEGEYKDYYIYEDGKIEEKEDYSGLSVGDYVNYDIYYENLDSYNNEYHVKDEYTGWRIISIDKESNIVKLVSAGIPLTYHYSYGNTLQSVETLTTNFLDDLTVYEEYGFKDKNNNLISNTSEMKLLFLNDVTSQNLNFPSVVSLTKEDIEKVMGYLRWGNFVEEDLFAIPCNDLNDGKYASYWLASSYYSQQLWAVSTEGKIENRNNKTIGIRPVVTLVSNIKFIKDEESSSSNKVVWNISLQN